MKILIVSFEFPPQPGGIGTYSFQIAKNLSNLGEDITVLAFSRHIKKKDILQFDNNLKFKIIRYENYYIKILNIIYRTFITFLTVKKNNYDIIYITYPPAGILAYFIKKIQKIPYIIVGHGSEFLTRNLLKQKIIRFIYSNSDLIISNSRYTSKLIIHLLGKPVKIETIPLGADESLFDYQKYTFKDLKKKYALQNRKIILTVGNLLERKGHRYVLEAIVKIKQEIPELLYLIVGRGPYKNELLKMIKKLHLEQFVKMVGYTSTIDLVEYYALCDVFILNSIIDNQGNTEGFGIVLIEAALMGKPVIGTKNCGIEDAIDDNYCGLLVPMGDPDATAQALKKILMNSELAKKMGGFGYERAKKKFTWNKVAIKTQSVVRKMENLV